MASPTPAPLEPVRVAPEVWIGAALLHKTNPTREDFSIEEILARIRQESVHPILRSGVRTHIALHCVANRPANPARLRMLYATTPDRRRLYRPGDACHADRTGRHLPDPAEIPVRYHYLLDWYQKDYLGNTSTDSPDTWLSGLLSMQGMMKGMWADEHPDDYVRRLRADWE